METSLKTIKNLHATEHGYTDWQDLRESVQDDTEYEQHWHAVCVRAQEQALRNAAGNAKFGYGFGGVSSNNQYIIDRSSITNKQNLVR